MTDPTPATPPVITPRSAARRRNLMILGIVISSIPTAAVVLAFPVGNRFVESNWKQFRSQWEARGEIFDIAGVLDPPVAEDRDNFAKAPIIDELYQRADAQKAAQAARHQHAGHDHAAEAPQEAPAPASPARLETFNVLSTQQVRMPNPKPALLYLSGQPVNLNLHVPARSHHAAVPYLLETYAPHQAVIDELFAAAERPEAYFPLDRERPYATNLAHLPSIINACHSLRIFNLALIEAGESQAARAAGQIAGLLRVIRHGTNSPGLGSFTVRTLAVESAGLEPVWQALYRQSFTDAQWQAIDTELRAFEFGPRLLKTLRFERASMIHQVEGQFAHAQSQPFSMPPAWVQLAGLQEYGELTQRFWFTGPGGDRVLKDRPRIDQLEAIEAQTADLPVNAENLIIATGVLPVAEFARRAQQIEITRDHALVAIALERHRLATGSFPETLSELTPKWMAELPVNAETGHPPRYDRLPDGAGYRLRNLGEDGGDGQPAWIMPPPAAAPEVAKPS